MAFPTSPVNGQIYKDKIYNTNRWVKKDNYDFGDNSIVSTLHMLPFDNTTKYYFTAAISLNSRSTFDCSTLVPVGAKAVLIKTMLHATPTNTSQYGYVIVGFSDTNTFTGSYNKNNAQVSLIGTANAVDSYVGNGGAESIVKLDASRKFYSYADTYSGVSSSNVYIVVQGYYI